MFYQRFLKNYTQWFVISIGWLDESTVIPQNFMDEYIEPWTTHRLEYIHTHTKDKVPHLATW